MKCNIIYNNTIQLYHISKYFQESDTNRLKNFCCLVSITYVFINSHTEKYIRCKDFQESDTNCLKNFCYLVSITHVFYKFTHGEILLNNKTG